MAYGRATLGAKPFRRAQEAAYALALGKPRWAGDTAYEGFRESGTCEVGVQAPPSTELILGGGTGDSKVARSVSMST
jgi:hypothetical protein